TQTGGIGGVAVKLYYLLVGDSRSLMQSVNILGDDAAGLALVHQMGDRPMPAIWLGAREGFVSPNLAPPGLSAHLLGGKKVAEFDRLVFGPDTAGASEIGYSGLGADAGAGENHRATARGEHVAEFGDRMSHNVPTILLLRGDLDQFAGDVGWT